MGRNRWSSNIGGAPTTTSHTRSERDERRNQWSSNSGGAIVTTSHTRSEREDYRNTDFHISFRCILSSGFGPVQMAGTSRNDFMFGASSIASINAKILAAFSAAAGKQSSRFSESEESDPDWGCWSVSQELRNPSIRIIFPTIERVKNASSGILASRRILCFSQVD
ncbi:hypothetical protein RND71_017345 [Anisodus tanguticus]|uniref:Uncharacterized protein n=1 Tax=Anisodus tanguticus TaxID=243964 RepID=A0AAE1S3C2_9SOLA|nr:hypothetical protein RND71_017345 [Anisodus tanguticus]